MGAYGSRKQILNSAVICPVCQAGQGETCLTEEGGPRKKFHWDRVETWQDSPYSVKFPRTVTSDDIDTALRVVGDDDS